MIEKVTQNVAIKVEVVYEPQMSNVVHSEYFFSYAITMLNRGKNTVQLLRRHWFIHDSNVTLKEVEGEGVVGQKPILHPSEHFQYSSGCAINTELGKMQGYYIFKDLHTAIEFKVEIPEFIMVVPYKLN